LERPDRQRILHREGRFLLLRQSLTRYKCTICRVKVCHPDAILPDCQTYMGTGDKVIYQNQVATGIPAKRPFTRAQEL